MPKVPKQRKNIFRMSDPSRPPLLTQQKISYQSGWFHLLQALVQSSNLVFGIVPTSVSTLSLGTKSSPSLADFLVSIGYIILGTATGAQVDCLWLSCQTIYSGTRDASVQEGKVCQVRLGMRVSRSLPNLRRTNRPGTTPCGIRGT